MSKLGLNLTGGGARGAYQAGVLKALSESLKRQNKIGPDNPIRYWSGVSAGSINQAYALAGVDDLPLAIKKLVRVWSGLEPKRVYRTDLWWLSQNSFKWIKDLSFGSASGSKVAKSLLDTAPLFELLSQGIRYNNIQKHLEAGVFDGAVCSAYSYRDNETVNFIQSHENISWDHPRNYSKNVKLGPEHIMASCAIPSFPSVQLDGEYMADGSFRSLSPLNPIMNMGANKVLMVGVRGPNEVQSSSYAGEPHLAKVAGLIMNALFFDTLDLDMEKSQQNNLDLMIVRPSIDVAEIALEMAKEGLPGTVSFLLSGLGSGPETAELASYILFESRFTKELIALGYQDFNNRKDEIENWLYSE